MSSTLKVTIELQLVGLLCGLFFWLLPLKIVALVPICLYLLLRLLPLFYQLSSALPIYLLAGLALFIDDISQVAWGRSLEPFTEPLGMILYESIGINGLEAVSLLLLVWYVATSSAAQRAIWWRLGIVPLIVVSSAIFLSSFYSLVVGQIQGGSLNVHFIQTRFLHLLPLWTVIGFLSFHHVSQAVRLGLIIAIFTLIKSVQGLFIYFIARQSVDDEYLVDHYFSMFAVYYLAFALAALWFQQLSWRMRSLLVAGLPFVFAALVLNDRRTAYIGLVFAILLLASMLPFAWYRRYVGRIIMLAVAFSVYVAVTWPFEPPIGIVGSTYRSISAESSAGIVSYRELENANLLNAVASAPILGLGTGREFEERFLMPDISFVYDRYRMIPHNLLLSMWSFAGPLGIACMALCFSCMIAVSGRLLRLSQDKRISFVAMTSLFLFVQYIVYTYGDLGLQIPRNQLFVGLLFGVCWRLLMQQSLPPMTHKDA